MERIQEKFARKEYKNTDGWEPGLSAEKIQSALRDWQADALPGGYYRTTKPSEDLVLILSAFGVAKDLRLPTVSTPRNILSIGLFSEPGKN